MSGWRAGLILCFVSWWEGAWLWGEIVFCCECFVVVLGWCVGWLAAWLLHSHGTHARTLNVVDGRRVCVAFRAGSQLVSVSPPFLCVCRVYALCSCVYMVLGVCFCSVCTVCV